MKLVAIILALIVNLTALVAILMFTSGIGILPPDTEDGEKLDPAVADSMRVKEPDDRIASKKEIEQERARLETRQRALEAEAIRVEALKDEVEHLLRKKLEMENQRVEELAKLYEGMKGNEVASVMEGLSDTLIVQILPKMKERQAAKVLSAMHPGRAAKISRMMTTWNE
ncbi:MAG: hypothetical protein DRP97_00130 [Candidatus Latescibacterota bacterium]|nr:MAG: hypothetical protein DRP97_00130 [Candidatus Latescibacterota bacterium]